MLNFCFKIRTRRIIASFFLLNFLIEIFSPSLAFALTSGPAQEEFASFEPAATTDMVDLYTGDFNYNLPLLSVPGPNGGYPINLSYHSGIGMEQEASWVGLGWTLNVGAINRNLRGLPDDFNGDMVTTTQHVRENVTASLNIPTDEYRELVGFPVGDGDGGNVSQQLQLYYNNYRGLGTRYGVGFSSESSPIGLNISSDSQNGMGIGLTFSAKSHKKMGGLGFELGLDYNSRQGLQSLNFTSSYSKGLNLEHEDTKSGIKYNGSGNAGGSSTLSFGTVFGVPKTTMEMKSTTVPFSVKFPTAEPLFQFSSSWPISGSVYTSKVAKGGVDKVPAQGYINTSSIYTIMKDFSRKETGYSKKIPYLPTSSFTYDLYTQTGQGTGSMFRPHLNTFGVLNNAEKISKDMIYGGGFEIGAGGSLDLHVGVDFQYGDGTNRSGIWQNTGNDSDLGVNLNNSYLKWKPENNGVDYESYYFQVIGEKTGFYAEDDYLKDLAGDRAVRLKISKDQGDNSWLTRHFVAEDELVYSEVSSSGKYLSASNQTVQKGAAKRVKRTTNIETLTTVEAEEYGYSKGVKYLSGGVEVAKDFSKPSHHISEISMLQADGMRYVYGLPTYNNKQIDNLFAVDEFGAINKMSATVHSTGGAVNHGGINLTSTHDQFLSKNEMPAYANAWLLTAIYSVDYLDATGDGPTDDDYGYWVKFNYEKVADAYKWRAPFSGANFNDGARNENRDNKASYTYGEKELYVLKSIETKTHKAIFETSSRKDGFESAGEYSNSGLGATTMKKLDRILLYTKKELSQTSPVPTKIVNFEYSYDLCRNVENNNHATEVVSMLDENGNRDDVNINQHYGKLTLNKVFFTYQTSSRGQMSPYVFKYGDLNNKKQNPDYDKKSMDRWGNYRDLKAYEYTSGSAQVISYPYLDFPYTEQDPEYYSGTNAIEPAQWTLKEISLPTGGKISIEYEHDDYAYVENKRALRMYDICALTKNGTDPGFSNVDRKRIATEIDTEDGATGGGRNCIWFKLERNITLENHTNTNSSTPLTDVEVFKKLYIDNLGSEMVYFNLYSKLLNNAGNDDFDYVRGYGELDPTGYGLSSDLEYGYIKLKNEKLASPVNTLGMWVSPFTRRSLEHLRSNRMELIFPTASPTGGAASQIMTLFAAIPGQLTDLMSTTIGFNNYAYGQGWGQSIMINGYSKIRLCDPDYKKIGGGVRVKKIEINDSWKNDLSSSSSADNSIYGQEYEYTTKKIINNQELIISSGVAYEPQIGSEESALKNAITYTNSIPLHGMYNLFLETPLMEEYYPAPSVGYSKVTVRSIAPSRALAENASNDLSYSSAPITIHEFYTQKDFPVLLEATDMNPGQPMKIPIMIPGVFTSLTTRQAKSQGYSIITNDMAGKPKSISVLTRNGNQIISKQKFTYFTEQAYNENTANKLLNKVQTLEINDDNYNVWYVTSILGEKSEVFIDMNEDSQEMNSFGLQTNFDFHYPTPAFMVMPIPTVNITNSSLRTVVFNKVINRTGIIKMVETTTNESTIITENLAFDIETGEPILTKVTNEFKDPIYNLNYPGHWYYQNMSGAYKNSGLNIDPAGSTNFTADANGYIDVSSIIGTNKSISDYFTKGDLLFVDIVSGGSDGKYHVYNIDEVNNKVQLMNSLGVLFPPNAVVSSIKVLKSGFKNMQSTNVGNLAFKQMDATFVKYDPADPTTEKQVDDNLNLVFENSSNNKILNASAIEYSNDWQVFCGPYQSAKSKCICKLNDCTFEMLNFLKVLHYGNILFDQNVPIYDKTSDSYLNGFSQDLLNASPKLVSIKSSMTAGQKLYFNGYINTSTNDFYAVFHHDVVNPINLSNGFANSDCVLKLHSSTGNVWYDIISFESVKMKDRTGEECVPSGFDFQVSVVGSNDLVDLSCTQQVPSGCSTMCQDCWSFMNCYQEINPDYSCGIPENYAVNPYLAGMKGMWRPKATYAYKTDRTQTDNIKNDGVYTDFVRFPWENVSSKDAKWINATTVTKYSPYGFELENKDALGNYSSAIYGYQQSLVTAVGNNARYNELAYDNFEDYKPSLDCIDKHFKFDFDQTSISSLFAHTGKYSMKVGTSTSIDKDLTVFETCNFVPMDDVTDPTVPEEPSTNVAHKVNECDCIGSFSPIKNKKYIASVWVKETEPTHLPIPGLASFSGPKLKITVTTGSGPVVYTMSTTGNVIDGWQQIMESFTIPNNATGVTVELLNTSSSHLAFYDDIRIHPYDANMVSYVYDPITLKTMAELDANNFATIYVYDDEGHLIKVKKETVQGIKTIKESRINTKKLYE